MNRDTVVLITGASSGIGAATSLAFARRGCRLALGARSLDRLQRLQQIVERRYGVDVLVQACDVRSDADVQALVDATLQRFGRIDVLVNNAGIGLYGLVEETSDDELRALLETNLLGAQRAIREVVPIMRRQGSGHIVNVGSVVGKRGWPLHGAYAASKFALTGLSQSLSAELAGTGVSVSLVLPASTRTEFFRHSAVTVKGFAPRPLGIVQGPGAVAATIARTVERPRPEVYTVGVTRWAMVLAEAFPRLADAAGRLYMRTGLRGVQPTTSMRRSSAAEATSATAGAAAPSERSALRSSSASRV